MWGFIIRKTIEFCKKEQEKYIRIIWESKIDTEINSSEILKNDNEEKIIVEDKTTEEEKKNSTKIVIEEWESIEEVNKEIGLLIWEYNERSSIIEDKNCENYKYKWTRDLCKSMKKDYEVDIMIPNNENSKDFNNKNINEFLEKMSNNLNYLENTNCKKEKEDVIEFCNNLKTRQISLESTPKSISIFLKKIEKDNKILETIDCKKEDKDVIETCNNMKKNYNNKLN